MNHKGLEPRGRDQHPGGAFCFAPESPANSIIRCSSIKTLLNSVCVGPVGCGRYLNFKLSCLACEGSGGIAAGMTWDLLFVSLQRTAG